MAEHRCPTCETPTLYELTRRDGKVREAPTAEPDPRAQLRDLIATKLHDTDCTCPQPLRHHVFTTLADAVMQLFEDVSRADDPSPYLLVEVPIDTKGSA